jgi:hypothetical protein
LASVNAPKDIPSKSAAGQLGKEFGDHGPRGPNGGGVEAVVVRAVVVTVIVVLVPGVTDTGLNVAADPGGNPEAVNVTGLGNGPPTGAVAIVNITA